MFFPCVITIDLNGSPASESTPLFCTKASELYHYVVVRRDLPLGDQLAQACHAAGESPGPKPEPGCTMVVLHAADEQHLHIIRARLDKAGLPYGTVIECPDDEDYPSQLMAIGLAPTTDRASVKKVLSSLPLAR
jgi:peptidyl-tRNA hydrolase